MIGLSADFHTSLSRRDNPFFPHTQRAIYAFDKLCADRDVDMVFLLGDLFDTKYQVATKYLIDTNEMIAMLAEKRPVVIFRGNHDSTSLNELNTNLCENYKHFNNVRVVNDYELICHQGIAFHCLAYFEIDELVDKINNIKGKFLDGYKNVLLGHMGVDDFEWHGSADSEVTARINYELLEPFDHVYLGHFHGYQSKRNITYVSSPIQTRHGDETAKHGFVLFNPKTMTTEFVENTDTPRFITLDFNKANIQHALTLNNHYIRLVVHQHVQKDVLAAVKAKLLINNYDVTWKFDVAKDNLQFSTIKNWDEVSVGDLDELLESYLTTITKPPATNEEMLHALLEN